MASATGLVALKHLRDCQYYSVWRGNQSLLAVKTYLKIYTENAPGTVEKTSECT